MVPDAQLARCLASPQLGDWRPPDVFSFDQGTDTLIDLESKLNPAGRQLLTSTLGIRSAGSIGGLWMSPPIGNDKKLTSADTAGWAQVWSAADYEPDPVTARTYSGGALHSQGGKLYWGTMQVPFVAALTHAQVYAPYYEEAGTTALVADVLGTPRAISIFRGDDFDTTPSTSGWPTR